MTDRPACAICGDPDCDAYASEEEYQEETARVRRGDIPGITLETVSLENWWAEERAAMIRKYGTDDAGYCLMQVARELAAVLGAGSGRES